MSTWHDVIGPLKDKEYFRQAWSYQHVRRAQGISVFPPEADVFNAFKYTPWDQVKIVILGQDPYHERGQAMGLCFSVPPKIRIPPSLLNIYKELKNEYPEFQIPDHGCLIPWARQGVLLLNSTLTVDEGSANSHSGKGWEEFTDAVVAELSEKREGLVFLLWGASAARKGQGIDARRHLVLKCAHPSPLSASRGFFGCGHFRKANEYLASTGREPINWQLPLHLDGDEEL